MRRPSLASIAAMSSMAHRLLRTRKSTGRSSGLCPDRMASELEGSPVHPTASRTAVGRFNTCTASPSQGACSATWTPRTSRTARRRRRSGARYVSQPPQVLAARSPPEPAEPIATVLQSDISGGIELRCHRVDNVLVPVDDRKAHEFTHVLSAISVVETLLAEQGRPGCEFRLEITSTLHDRCGRKLGLGSSGAVTVAAIAALCRFHQLDLDRMQRYRLAMLSTVVWDSAILTVTYRSTATSTAGCPACSTAYSPAKNSFPGARQVITIGLRPPAEPPGPAAPPVY